MQVPEKSSLGLGSELFYE